MLRTVFMRKVFLGNSPKILHKKPIMLKQKLGGCRKQRCKHKVLVIFVKWSNNCKMKSDELKNDRFSKNNGMFRIFNGLIAFLQKNCEKSTEFLNFTILFEQYVN